MSLSDRSVEIEGRPPALVAAVALTLLGVVGGFATLPLIPDDAPSFVLPLVIGVSLVTVLAAWGLWQCAKWGAVLVFVISAFNGLTGLPGIFADDLSTAFRVMNVVGIAVAVAICWLLLLRQTRQVLH